jgi:Fe-S cluster assembly protein SufD
MGFARSGRGSRRSDGLVGQVASIEKLPNWVTPVDSGSEPSWIEELRDTAFQSLVQSGFPSRHDEEWRYLSLKSLSTDNFVLSDGAPFNKGLYDIVDSLDIGEAYRFVFVDGYFSEELSRGLDSAQNFSLMTFAEALDAKLPCVSDHWARHAPVEGHPFTALNTARMQSGAVLHIPHDVQITQPIHFISLSASSTTQSVFHPRILIHAEKGSRATILESYSGPAEKTYFANPVTEVILEAAAIIDHYKLQCEGNQASHIGTLHVSLDRDSDFRSHSFSFGGLLARHDIHVNLEEEGASCTLNGLYVVSDSQEVDHHTRVNHLKPHGTSRELYKGIVGGRAKAVFNGKIYVAEGASKTDSDQQNRNLLLSAEAEVDPKPELEIYNDDVRCAHGATVGQLDEQALFYLRSRGIMEEEARRLLTHAFAMEVFESITDESIRKICESRFEESFDGTVV